MRARLVNPRCMYHASVTKKQLRNDFFYIGGIPIQEERKKSYQDVIMQSS